jgi:hypothetical protein
MISTSFKFTRPQARIGRGVSLSAFQMQRLADVGLRSVKARAVAGIGSDDAAMPGLKTGYARQKQRKGGVPVRDLTLTGDMLKNLTVRTASESGAKIAFTASLARTKALANEQRYPWLGWSAGDVRKIVAEAQKMLRDSVSGIVGGLRSTPATLSRLRRAA